eukprot:GEMP01024150.1.p1 GENE.GEMP01024150.1~~GEMP01024150.1.p1  ORF type:complete len:368 (-),score=50.23 GEMP01024150.1:1171-2274(-)
MHRTVANVQLDATLEDLTRVVAEKQNVEPWRVQFFRDGVSVDATNPRTLVDLGDGKGVEVRICNRAALVSSLADPDGGGEVLLVNLDTKEIWRRYYTISAVICVAVSPSTMSSRTSIFCGSADGSLRKFDLAVSQPLLNIKHPKALTAIAIGEKSRFIFTGCEDGLVRKFSSRSGLCKLKFEPNVREERVGAIAISPCERFIYVSCGDMLIRKYDVVSGGCVSTYGSPSLRIWQICMSFCGLFIYAISDQEVQVFDMESSELISDDDQFQDNLDSKEPIVACEMSHEGGFLFLAIGSRVLKYETEDGKLIYSVEPHTADIISLAVSRNGDFVATTATDGTLLMLDADTGKAETILQEELLGECHFVP